MTRRRLVAIMAALGVAIAACGDDGGGEGSSTAAGEEASGATDDDARSTASAAEDAADETGGADADVDPDGVARVGYDLVAASSGGFGFDPRASKVTVTHDGIYHWIYGALMRPTADGLKPDLAKQATVVDPTTIEIELRDGLTFSDGTPLDAEAVKATFERNVEDPSLPAFRSTFYSLESVEVTGPTTVELHIPDGTAASWFDLHLGGHGAVVLPPNFDPDAPVGAGPFTVAEYVPEQRLVLEKNPDYWNADAIQLAGIEVISVSGAQAGASALGAGQIDFAQLDYSSIDAIGSDLDLDIEIDAVTISQIQMCKSQEPFDDPRVRQALSYAIDREVINEALFGGEGEPAWDLWPVGHLLHNDSTTEHYAYDPDRARELLAEAGLDDGFTFDLVPIPGANLPEMAQIVQQQWAEIGVTMNIVQSSNFSEDLYLANRVPVGIVPNTSANLGKLDQLSGTAINNLCAYEDPELDELVNELRTVRAESDEAVELWAEIQQIIVDEALMLPVTFQPQVRGYNGDRLGGFTLGAYAISVPDIWELHVKAGA